MWPLRQPQLGDEDETDRCSVKRVYLARLGNYRADQSGRFYMSTGRSAALNFLLR
jgi:hypothetical protein